VNKKSSWFSDFARKTARATGQPVVFALAGAVIVLWLVTGPLFGFSDTWQLIINTGTTIVTFLMVFLIQNTQNRDSEAMHIKMDELIRARIALGVRVPSFRRCLVLSQHFWEVLERDALYRPVSGKRTPEDVFSILAKCARTG
jgi:uncharacterized membrane protein